MNNWTAAEILLGAAVLALAMPREDGFLIPERRDWLGWLRRRLPGARLRSEEHGEQEARDYVRALRGEKEFVLRQADLPSNRRVWQAPPVTKPTPEQAARLPWGPARDPALTGSRSVPAKREKRPGDAPTVVMQVLRPFIEREVGGYLRALPSYDDPPGALPGGGLLPVPLGPVVLGTPDHHGAPQDVDGDQGEEGHL